MDEINEIKDKAILIIKSYLKSKRTVEFLNKGYLDLGEVKDKMGFDIYLTIAKVEATLSCLQEKYYFLIANEFINPKHPYWWQDYYSRSSYYRIKNQALIEFYDIYNAN